MSISLVSLGQMKTRAVPLKIRTIQSVNPMLVVLCLQDVVVREGSVMRQDVFFFAGCGDAGGGGDGAPGPPQCGQDVGHLCLPAVTVF